MSTKTRRAEGELFHLLCITKNDAFFVNDEPDLMEDVLEMVEVIDRNVCYLILPVDANCGVANTLMSLRGVPA